VFLLDANITPTSHISSVERSEIQDNASGPDVNTGGPKEEKPEAGSLTVCIVCRATINLAHICKKKCGIAAHCSLNCYCFDWPRHKFSYNLGRPVDATDYLVLACHKNEFPLEEDVADSYSFMYFNSGGDRCRLFQLYRRLVVDWSIDEDELRCAVEQNRLKEMLTFRCLQTGNPLMLREMQWLDSKEGFGAKGKGPGIVAIIKAA
jgi:hypothetical protein